ncbi:bacteriocin-protection protein [Flavobacterium sp. Sd200]|uniref:YdeI/OmpD-associated family protein n=1 Tax=Flavobacterium sp. Sd200 TaxID=2692211 RepID=UPI00136F8A93|nr:YdeI/OmpD-associated family protein [Flavobacterium sp. Sd200]MXN89865.1 bacteriocin-protection protein [Flavobacterium sp. Sd200]
MSPTFFETENDFREWLDKNHDKEPELLVGFYKTKSGRPSMTWPQSVDQALCYGWIDGVRKSAGEEAYTVRFTPRRDTSIWSTININKVEALKKSGLMQQAGLVAYAKRRESHSEIYSHEKKAVPELSPEFEAEFKANIAAWDFFEKQAPSYRKVVIHLIMSAKQEKTRRSRFDKVIAASVKGERISNWG